MVEGVYKNSTELMNLHGVSLGMRDVADACLYGRLNLFLQGDRGSGKTQLTEDIRGEFGDKSLYILGRNDMDTRELFQQIYMKLVLYFHLMVKKSSMVLWTISIHTMQSFLWIM